MTKTLKPLLPSHQRLLREFGERLRAARLRRHYSMEIVAARANLAVKTLQRVEDGDPSVAMRNYLSVLGVLQLEKDLNLMAKDDELGRQLQDHDLPPRRRAPKRKTPPSDSTP